MANSTENDNRASSGSGYWTEPWPRNRTAIVDLMEIARKRPTIHSAWEVNFEMPYQRIRTLQRKTGIGISLNAYLIYALAQSCRDFPLMTAFRWRTRNRIAFFDGVDVGTAVEWRQPGKPPQAVGARINAAEKKSLASICREMRDFGRQDPRLRPAVRFRHKIAGYPRWIRRLVWNRMTSHPERFRKFLGNVGLTNLNFVVDSQRPVYGFPLSPYTLTLGVGSLYDRSGNATATRHETSSNKSLCLTAMIDHEIVDGGYAARFAKAMTYFLEAGHGLDDKFADELVSCFPEKRRNS